MCIVFFEIKTVRQSHFRGAVHRNGVNVCAVQGIARLCSAAASARAVRNRRRAFWCRRTFKVCRRAVCFGGAWRRGPAAERHGRPRRHAALARQRPGVLGGALPRRLSWQGKPRHTDTNDPLHMHGHRDIPRRQHALGVRPPRWLAMCSHVSCDHRRVSPRGWQRWHRAAAVLQAVSDLGRARRPRVRRGIWKPPRARTDAAARLSRLYRRGSAS